MKLKDTLLSHFYLDENNCWVWTRSSANGYGRILDTYTHRISYQLFVDDIPENYCIDHLCRNRLCFNPEHLEAVTQTENKLRGVGTPAQNKLKTHCKRGHEFTADNTWNNPKKPTHRNCKQCFLIKGREFKKRNANYNRDYLRRWRAEKNYA